ncbi:MAG TPA: radical SAM protein [Steroidobacteraceae bacterium]|nr:radical SAM protein [Steroidobacteraceae bacterium]
MNASTTKTNLLGLTRSELEAYVVGLGEKPFRARQLHKWLYKSIEGDFEKMTDLAKSFRQRLADVAEVRTPAIKLSQVSADGTRKWLLYMDDSRKVTLADLDAIDARQCIEMVYIPEPGRGTLCISSQIGCAMDCTFCSTAQQGFNRNLTTAEIVGQVWMAERELRALAVPAIDEAIEDTADDSAANADDVAAPVGAKRTRLITNIVFMGMGEPLANYRNVIPATEIFMDDLGFDISRRRVTISTSGLVPQMMKLAEETNCALAVSLHAPTDELRDQLVPINRKHKIADLLDACWHYLNKQNARSITFEYVMLDGVNDQPEHAMQLVKLLRGHPGKVNLIPFNPFPNTRYKRSPAPVIERFRELLNTNGVTATTRRTRGDDIDAACGQLVGRVQDRTLNRMGDRLRNIRVVAG